MIAYYDLARCPPTFDAVTAAVRFECERIRRRLDRFSIEVLPGQAGGFRVDSVWPRSVAERIKLRERIALPIFRMLPSCERVTVRGNRNEAGIPAKEGYGFNQYIMHFEEFVRAYGRGVRPLRPPELYARDPLLITITLRECEHWPQRNSKLDHWIYVAERLSDRGWRVVVIRDTAKGDDRLQHLRPRFEVRPAPESLERRGALYRSAFCNMFVNNGPAWFALAADCPVLMLRPATEGIGKCYGAAWFKHCGAEPGRNFPGAPVHQMIDWSDDTADNIIRAFGDFHAANGGVRHESPVHA